MEVDLPNNTTVLIVDRATRAQSGNYTCEAQQAVPASNYVHVISGKTQCKPQLVNVILFVVCYCEWWWGAPVRVPLDPRALHRDQPPASQDSPAA